MWQNSGSSEFASVGDRETLGNVSGVDPVKPLGPTCQNLLAQRVQANGGEGEALVASGAGVEHGQAGRRGEIVARAWSALTAHLWPRMKVRK